MKFRKKPVVIDAVLWAGSNLDEVMPFFGDLSKLPGDGEHIHPGIGHTPVTGTLHIPTLEGVHDASPGDWIIKGVKGEFYPCKPDIFALTYEPVDPQTATAIPQSEVAAKALEGQCPTCPVTPQRLREIAAILHGVRAELAEGDICKLADYLESPSAAPEPRVMLAAPDLLEACIVARDSMLLGSSLGLTAIKAAIERATGDPQTSLDEAQSMRDVTAKSISVEPDPPETKNGLEQSQRQPGNTPQTVRSPSSIVVKTAKEKQHAK